MQMAQLYVCTNWSHEGLDSVTTEQIKKFFRLCRDYERVYREGLTGKGVEERIKVYKSHRHVTVD